MKYQATKKAIRLYDIEDKKLSDMIDSGSVLPKYIEHQLSIVEEHITIIKYAFYLDTHKINSLSSAKAVGIGPKDPQPGYELCFLRKLINNS